MASYNVKLQEPKILEKKQMHHIWLNMWRNSVFTLSEFENRRKRQTEQWVCRSLSRKMIKKITGDTSGAGGWSWWRDDYCRRARGWKWRVQTWDIIYFEGNAISVINKPEYSFFKSTTNNRKYVIACSELYIIHWATISLLERPQEAPNVKQYLLDWKGWYTRK